MKIIIGLGNPEKKYENTRHNTGFLMLDKIKEKWNFPEFEFNKKFDAEISKGEINNKEILLVKPQTFMNLSGTAVKSILDFYKLTPEDIVVIHDDIDIALGKYKIATDSSSAGHNGVQNIIDQLGTQKFKRIRVGIGQSVGEALVCRLDTHPPRVDETSPRVEAGDFVLEKFSAEELETIKKISENILGEIEKLF
ncbi:MAG TPA: aminoacyl-tRNA hydrolase [Candidatus Moranbacteria bacterium]|nr:aminoacyl-tRNA hydrolase [Candidatus Moranbacteria bacterium]